MEKKQSTSLAARYLMEKIPIPAIATTVEELRFSGA